MPLRIYLVENSAAIRENLIPALKELADSQVLGFAATEAEAVEWLATGQEFWKLAIVDPFLDSGPGFAVLASCQGRHAPPASSHADQLRNP